MLWDSDKKQRQWYVRLIGIGAIWMVIGYYGMIVLRDAWVAEDAYITFRTVDNFIKGYGLTWNPSERVQAYTNPLMMLAMSLLYYFTKEIYLTSIFFSILVSVAVLVIMAFGIARSYIGAGIGILILLFSRAFIDYSTSGLENPLTHLTIVLFCWYFYKTNHFNRKEIFISNLIAGVAMINRMDTILLFFPGLISIFFLFGCSKPTFVRKISSVLFGFAPFILWEIFTIIYYGFPFPNTAYAKLGTGISQKEYFQQGIYYLIDSLERDPVMLFSMLFAILFCVIRRNKRSCPLVIGMITYVLYVVRIGGDFMSGRFLTGPFFLAVVIIVHEINFSKIRGTLAICPLLMIGLMNPINPVIGETKSYLKEIGKHGITDERIYYYEESALIQNGRWMKVPRGELVEAGKIARAEGNKVMVKTNIGYFGFYAGPKVHIIDPLGLSDPLLARLPAIRKRDWRIGHFKRTIPEGYVDSIERNIVYGNNMIKDRRLSVYFKKLSLITRGEIFHPKRIRAIWDMNTGSLDDLVDAQFYK